MAMEKAHAAGQSGTARVGASDLQESSRPPDASGAPESDDPPETGAPAPPSDAPADLCTEDALAKSDEELRRLAVARLSEHLDIGSSLVTRCEELASVHRGDRIGPIYAAARLMRANAQVAKALAQVALLETRHRSIVERIQRAVPKPGELNCSSQNRGEEGESEEQAAEGNLKVWHRLQQIVEETIRFRQGESDGQDVLTELIQREEQTLARIRAERRRPA